VNAFVGLVVMKCGLVLSLIVAAAVAAAQGPTSVIGNGWGLDHVIVAVSNPDVVKQVFVEKLGFSPMTRGQNPSNGIENTFIILPPAPYIELTWPYQAPAADARPVAFLVRKKLETGGGPAAYNVNVSPAEGAAGTIRLLGLRVSLPPSPMRRDAEGKESRGPWQFADIDPRDQTAQPYGVPGGPGVGYLEYQNQADHLKPERFQRAMELSKSQVPDPRRPAGEIHANTARKLLSVWVVVPNADEAVKQAARFGFAATKNHRKALGEEGQEVQCGEGTIAFFEAAHPDSALANLVKKRGLGPFGISIGVADLKMAQRIVQDGTHTSLETEQTEDRMSFIIPSEVAAGTVFEFVQQ
jgi:hypothetical protein